LIFDMKMERKETDGLECCELWRVGVSIHGMQSHDVGDENVGDENDTSNRVLREEMTIQHVRLKHG